MSEGFSASPVYEVVSGQILLSHREKFCKLHSELLLPMMKTVGIQPKLLLITEVGRFGRFFDVYVYQDLAEYQTKTDKLLAIPEIRQYYEQISQCIHGSISVELMRELPYAHEWK